MENWSFCEDAMQYGKLVFCQEAMLVSADENLRVDGMD